MNRAESSSALDTLPPMDSDQWVPELAVEKVVFVAILYQTAADQLSEGVTLGFSLGTSHEPRVRPSISD